MLYSCYDEGPTVSYKTYKAEKFEKTKNKIRALLSGIRDTSLKHEDKTKLIAEVKKIVADF